MALQHLLQCMLSNAPTRLLFNTRDPGRCAVTACGAAPVAPMLLARLITP